MNRLGVLCLVLAGCASGNSSGNTHRASHGRASMTSGTGSSSSTGSTGSTGTSGTSGSSGAGGGSSSAASAGDAGTGATALQQPRDLCASIREASAPVLEHAEQANPRVYDRLRARVESYVRCLETPNGAWGMVVERLNPVVREYGAFQREEGRWSLVHLSRDGTRVAVSPAMPLEGRDFSDDPLNLMVGSPESGALGDTVLYDYDQDGEPELVLVLREDVQDYGEVLRGRVWTFRDGRVEIYNPARDIVLDQARDADGDGRPDLVTHVPYHGEWEDFCIHRTVPVDGPNLLAHALPDGSFSLTDAVALRAAQQSCPAAPESIIVQGGNGIDNRASALNVVCARLHGVPEREITTQIQRDCHPGERTNTSCTPGCNDPGLLARWAHTDPPVSLAPPEEHRGRRRRRR